MFEPTIGVYHNTIHTENVSRVMYIMHRLNKEGRVYLIMNDDSTHIIVVCQSGHDASDIAHAMIESGCSFEYHYIEFGG